MKLIDIMKRYNRCILKENAKLRSIYNALIRESGGEEQIDDCEVCGDPSCKNGEKCGANPSANECEMTLEEFLGEKEEEDGKTENGEAKDGEAKDGKSEKDGEAKDGVNECDSGKNTDELDEEELTELQSAEEFFNDAKDGAKDDGKKKADKKNVNDSEEESVDESDSGFKPDDFYKAVGESYGRRPRDLGKALGESLSRHYKKANRRLFNF